MARATKMIPSSSSFSVSELSLSSSSSDSTVKITAARQGQELSGIGQSSSCLFVPPGAQPLVHLGRAPLLVQTPILSCGCYSTGLGGWGSLRGRGVGLQSPRRQRKTDPQRKPSGNHTSRHLHLLSTPDPIVNWKHKHLEGWKAHQRAALLGPWFYCRDTGPQDPPILQSPDQAPFMTHSLGPQGL